jgi:hypothetical protein
MPGPPNNKGFSLTAEALCHLQQVNCRFWGGSSFFIKLLI